LTQGDELFTNFRTLCVPCRKAKKAWKDQCDGLVGQRTPEQFEDAYEAFKIVMLRKLKYLDQIEYMRDLREPGPMSVEDFKKKLASLNELAQDFPDAPLGSEGLSDNEMVRIFHNAMPAEWQKSYKKAGNKYTDEDVEDVCDYVEQMEEDDPFSI